MKKRLAEIDIIRGITITLVVAAHTEIPSFLNEILKTFRMPLFFIVSGYLFSTSKYLNNFTHLLKSRSISLILPYFSACLFSYFIWVIISYIEGDTQSLVWYQPIVGFFYGNGSTLLNQPLWFLVCLFCCQITFCLTLSYVQKFNVKLQTFFYIVLGLIGFSVGNYIQLPWGLDIALVSQLFLFIGSKLKEYKVLETIKPFNISTVLLVLLFVSSFVLNGSIDMNTRSYNNVFLFYTGGISGSLLILKLTKLLSSFKLIVKLFSYLGRESLTILIFHTGFSFVLITGIGRFLLHGREFNWIIYTVGGIVISLVIGQLIKNVPIFNLLFNGKPLPSSRTYSTNNKHTA
jgi:fucose 4-O-acetylase-like acetyltransferase